MKTPIDPKTIASVCGALMASDAKTATKYVSANLVVKATWRHKPRANHTREEMVVTVGAPNYLDTKFIKACKLAGEPMPVKKVQLRAYPIKRK